MSVYLNKINQLSTYYIEGFSQSVAPLWKWLYPESSTPVSTHQPSLRNRTVALNKSSEAGTGKSFMALACSLLLLSSGVRGKVSDESETALVPYGNNNLNPLGIPDPSETTFKFGSAVFSAGVSVIVDTFETLCDPYDRFFYPNAELVLDAAILSSPQSFQQNNPEIHAIALERMQARVLMLQKMGHDFRAAPWDDQVRMISYVYFSAKAPSVLMNTLTPFDNLYKFGTYSSPPLFNAVWTTPTIKITKYFQSAIREIEGAERLIYVITQKGKLLITNYHLSEHINIGGGTRNRHTHRDLSKQPVVSAGEAWVKEKKIVELDNKSGHFRAWTTLSGKLVDITEHVFTKYGYREVKGLFEDHTWNFPYMPQTPPIVTRPKLKSYPLLEGANLAAQFEKKVEEAAVEEPPINPFDITDEVNQVKALISNWSTLGNKESVKKVNEIGSKILEKIEQADPESDPLLELESYVDALVKAQRMMGREDNISFSQQPEGNFKYFTTGIAPVLERREAMIELARNFQLVKTKANEKFSLEIDNYFLLDEYTQGLAKKNKELSEGFEDYKKYTQFLEEHDVKVQSWVTASTAAMGNNPSDISWQNVGKLQKEIFAHYEKSAPPLIDFARKYDQHYFELFVNEYQDIFTTQANRGEILWYLVTNQKVQNNLELLVQDPSNFKTHGENVLSFLTPIATQLEQMQTKWYGVTDHFYSGQLKTLNELRPQFHLMEAYFRLRQVMSQFGFRGETNIDFRPANAQQPSPLVREVYHKWETKIPSSINQEEWLIGRDMKTQRLIAETVAETANGKFKQHISSEFQEITRQNGEWFYGRIHATRQELDQLARARYWPSGAPNNWNRRQ